MAAHLTQFLNRLQVIAMKEKDPEDPSSPISVPIQLLPTVPVAAPVGVMTDVPELPKTSSETNKNKKKKKKPTAAKTKTKNRDKRRATPYERPKQTERPLRKKPADVAVCPPQPPPREITPPEVASAKAPPLPPKSSKSSSPPPRKKTKHKRPTEKVSEVEIEEARFTRQISLAKIQTEIEERLTQFKRDMDVKPGMSSGDKRKLTSTLKRKFYEWYRAKVMEYMDGYLFPKKLLRKTFEFHVAAQKRNGASHRFVPVFTSQDVQTLVDTLNSYITKDLDLSETKNTKLRNLIAERFILYQSFLDFALFLAKEYCTEDEETFQSMKQRWLHTLAEPHYKSLGSSKLEQTAKYLQQYKLRGGTEPIVSTG
jgi:hypothetical protein